MGGRRGLAAILTWRAPLLALALAAACGDGPTGVETTPVARVEVSPGTYALRAGEVYRFAASPRGADGSILSEPVEWLSSDEHVARVDGSGVVTAHSSGHAVISARSGGRTGRASVTVEAAPAPVASVAITPASPMSLGVGAALQLAAVARGADGALLTGRAVEWTSSDTLVAWVSPAGVAEGRAEGSAVVTARVEGVAANAAVVVTFSRSPSVPVALVHVEAPRGRVEPGETMQLTATVRAANGSALEREVVWSSENPAIATVDASGRVTGRADGWVRITASAGGKSGWILVQVATWTRQALVEMGDGGLPGTFTIQPSATLGGYDFRVGEGMLRTIDGVGQGYFEIALHGWFLPTGGLGTQATYTVMGSYQRDVVTGTLTFYPAGAEPFGGVTQADGTLALTPRFPGSTAVTRLVFAAR
jgi:uncharacterized protein YjdB